jgi:hypothetical protein
MSRLPNHAMRSGALAVGVAAGLMVLASTTQSPDGFITSAFRGPLEALGGSAPAKEADLLAIGAGSSDIGEIAAIVNPGALNPGTPPGLTDPSVQAAYDAGMSVGAAPTGDAAQAAPAYKQSLDLPRVPVVDAQGRIDCTGSVSCLTDPVTKVTTVTYPDGVVALVQQVNDMTVVAYKTLTEALPAPFQALMPPAYTPTFTPPGGPAPRPAASVPAVQTPAPQTDTPSLDTPSLDAPSPDATPPSAAELPDFGANISRPRVIVTKPSQDLGPGRSESATNPGAIKIPAVKPTSPLDVVKDAIGSVVGAVTGNKAPSKTIRPPTAPTADSSGQDSVGQGPSGQGSSGQGSSGQGSAGQDSSDSAGGGQ